MDVELWSLLPEGLDVGTITIKEDMVIIEAVASAPSVTCPKCSLPSRHVHSHRYRTLSDLPWFGLAVRLMVRIRHFRCRNEHCPQQIFAEQIPGTFEAFSRRTKRLNEALLTVAYELGGKAGVRVADALGIDISRDSLLRLIQRSPLPSAGAVRVLSVDDWCWKKRHSYGTMLVDLEQHRPVDLLPDRNVDSFARWLTAHDSVEVVARDRGGTYSEGASTGAPHAIQVADRFHLLTNLGTAIEQFLNKHHRDLRAASAKMRHAAIEASGYQPRELAKTKLVLSQEAKRDRRKAEYDQVVALAGQNLTYKQITVETGVSVDTISRWLRADGFPEWGGGVPIRRPSKLDRYESYLRKRWTEGYRNATELYKEITKQGYVGSPQMVRYYVRGWRESQSNKRLPSQPPPPRLRGYLPHHLAWLLSQSELDADDTTYIEQLCEECADVRTVQGLASDFAQMIRDRDGERLSAWMDRAQQSEIPEMASFARGLGKDLAAVKAGLSSEWSQGQIEGQINRLKLLKRQMYGRAGFELLQRRVLYSPARPRRHRRQCAGSSPPTTSGTEHPKCA